MWIGATTISIGNLTKCLQEKKRGKKRKKKECKPCGVVSEQGDKLVYIQVRRQSISSRIYASPASISVKVHAYVDEVAGPVLCNGANALQGQCFASQHPHVHFSLSLAKVTSRGILNKMAF
jgi:hypothetical protein